MAREPAVREDSDIPETDVESSGNSGLLHRRSYLKLAGAASAAGAGLVGNVSAASEYDVIEARGQTIFVDDGETFENKLIDLGDGNNILIVAKGTNWTIRNVGFTGTYAHDNNTLLAVADTGSGHSTIENVYFGEGDPSASFSERGKMIWVDPDHSGHLDVRNCNFNIEGAIGIYGSAPSRNSNGRGGSIVLEGCCAIDNHHTAYRVTGGGDAIRNCVAVMREGAHANRGVWIEGGAHGGRVDVENVHSITENGKLSLQVDSGAEVRADGFHHTSGTLSISGDVDWIDRSTDPQQFVPGGCPTSAEAAASGDSRSDTDDGSNDDTSGDGGSGLPDGTIVVEGTGEPCNYRLEVEGTLVEDADVGALGEWGEIEGSTATGWVTYADRPDGFRFDGEVVDLEFLQGEASVTVNGESVDESDFEESADSSPTTIVVEGTGEPCNYRLEVDGSLVEDPEIGALGEWGEIEGSTATGWVTSPDRPDGLETDGEVVDLEFLQGEASVTVDGDPVDPADFDDDYDHTLTIAGRGIPSSYEVTVDGDLRTADEDIVVSGSTAEGTIESGVHEIDFSGSLTDVTFLDGEADVYLDDEQIDFDTEGDQGSLPHAILIDGSEAAEPSSYSFTVTGAVSKSEYRDANINEDDVVDGTTVRGVVDGWIDAYWFDGDIDDFTVLGEAKVDVEYDVRDQ